MTVRTQKDSLSRTIRATPRVTATTNDNDDKKKKATGEEETAPVSITATSSTSTTVGFGSVQIREYARRMGDNPGCRCGVSLTLDWDVQSDVTIDLEAYETSRPTRRDRSEMILPPEVRMQMMRDAGYARGEILTYVKKANIARGQRARTNETLQLAGAQEMAQRLVRGVLNKSVRRKSKQLEKETLRMHLQKDKENLTAIAALQQEKPQRSSSGHNWFVAGGSRKASTSSSSSAAVDASGSLQSINDGDEEVSAASGEEDVEVEAEESEFLSSSVTEFDQSLMALVEVDC